MSPPTIYELQTRADVLEGRVRDEGFAMTASWPINTEAEGSLHIKDKSAHWPIKRGQPKPMEEKTKKRGRSQLTLEELLAQDDPYAVSPEDALDAARREVKAWRMETLTSGSRRAQLDPLTEWFVLAWDAFEAPQFPFDEALRLVRVVDLELDKDVVGVLAEKKASDLILWDSSTRATKGKLGAPDGTKLWIDAIHHCAHRARSIDLNAAKQLSMTTDWPTAPTSSRPWRSCWKCCPSPPATPASIP
ncbi:MAG: hypothetical protein ACKOPT_11600 [Cyanobium sp.]